MSVAEITKHPIAWWEKAEDFAPHTMYGYNWKLGLGYMWICNCGAHGRRHLRDIDHKHVMKLWERHARYYESSI